MYNYVPQNYSCPFCSLVRGEITEHNSPDDVIYQNDFVTAFVAPKWWVNNPGHVIIVTNKHCENIYDTPIEYLHAVIDAAKEVSLGLKAAYQCDGTSLRQHNEPAGGQDVWHFHMHVFPRYENDKLYQNHDNKRFVLPEEKRPFVEKLKNYFAKKV